MTSVRPSDTSPVVFFDGVCGLCNRYIQFLIARDRLRILRFAPIQGETALRELPAEDREQLSSIIYIDSSGIFRKSDAVLRIASAVLSRSSLLWKAAGLLRIFPRYLRDAVYDRVAGNRYRFFGKHDSCPIPSPETRERFLP